MNALRLLLSCVGTGPRVWLGGLLPLALAGGLFAQTAPSITTQPPAVVAVDPGATATLTVVAAGTAPLSYQWLKNGNPMPGETGSTLVITNAQYGPNVGTYSVVVTNGYGSVTSQGSDLRINSAPYIISQPVSQTAMPGSYTTYIYCFALGWPLPTYQWWKDGVPIPGATNSGISFPSITAADAGDYSVAITNVYGSITSTVATLTVSNGLVIQAQPSPQTVLAGQGAVFSVTARPGLPATYQWQVRTPSSSAWASLADQGLYSGANTDTLRVSSVTVAMDQYQYRCQVTNANGYEPSNGVALNVQTLAYSGGYFGDLDSGGGHWALFLSGTKATFLAYLPDRHSVIVQPLTVAETGGFSATGTEALAGGAAGGAFSLTGQISGASGSGVRTVAGQLSGLGKAFTGAFKAGNGAQTAASGDFYTALALKADQGKVYSVIGYGGDTLAVIVTPTVVDGVSGTVSLSGTSTAAMNATTAGGAAFGLTVDIPGHTLKATFTPPGTGVRSLSFLGLAQSVASTSRLANVSVRSRAGSGDQTLIVGLVVAGSGSKPLLVRGIGPTLVSYGVAEAMANPQLRVYGTGGSFLDENDDWGGTGSLQSLFQTLGAFGLTAASKDSALSLALPAGAYSAHVTSTTGQAGIALLEVYDAAATGTSRLINLSARTTAGTGPDALIAGFVITGNAPVRVLIRGVGPALANYGVSQPLADPRLQLFDANGETVVENDNWGGASSLTDAFTQVGAFALGSGSSKDAALLVTLQPGVYSAQVSGVGGTTGIALVEIYEVP